MEGRTQADRKTSVTEGHEGTRRGENVYALTTDGQRKIPDVFGKKNLAKRGGQGWLSVGVQTSKAGKRDSQVRQTSGASKEVRQAGK